MNLDVADFIFTWNLTIGDLMTICVVNTSHMISLSHKWAFSFSNLEAIDQIVDCSSWDNKLTIVVSATITEAMFVVVLSSIGDMEWLILNYLCHRID